MPIAQEDMDFIKAEFKAWLMKMLPAKVRGLVQEWAEPHQKELLYMWSTGNFDKITPLV